MGQAATILVAVILLATVTGVVLIARLARRRGRLP